MRNAQAHEGRRRPHWRPAVAGLAIAALFVGATACAEDKKEPVSTDTTLAPVEADTDALFGTPNVATGSPVKIGYLSDGKTAAMDNSSEFKGAQAAVDYYNEFKGGIGGHEVELVTCETTGDPAVATDCANQFVQDGVVAVALGQSGFAGQAWTVLHEAGIPFMLLGANGTDILQDTQSTYNLNDGNATLFALPISIASEQNIDKVAFIVIDYPQATEGFEGPSATAPAILEEAGIDWDLYKLPMDSADVTPQMQQVVTSGAGLAYVIANPELCVKAFNGLKNVGYSGEFATLTYCIDDNTRAQIDPSVLDGMRVGSTVAIGAPSDESYQNYVAIMEKYQPGVDPDVVITMSGYTVTGALLEAAAGTTGEVTKTTVNAAIKAMPESVIPGTAGMVFQCDGTRSSRSPSVCTNQVLSAVLDDKGVALSYQVSDLPS